MGKIQLAVHNESPWNYLRGFVATIMLVLRCPWRLLTLARPDSCGGKIWTPTSLRLCSLHAKRSPYVSP